MSLYTGMSVYISQRVLTTCHDGHVTATSPAKP